MIRIKERAIADKNLISEISLSLGVSEKLSWMLVERGCQSVESARKFLTPTISDLYDPFLLKGISEAVERISLAKQNGETVVIYGDYDADGISAVTVLCRTLKLYGIDAVAVVPERENGYGLTEEVLSGVLEEYYPDLIITVDCGISAVKEVAELKDLGVDVIITDHHEIPEQIPDCTVINCKIKEGNDYPFDGLCGAGVAFKLAQALIGKKAEQFLDVVAVATIADSMPLLSENRAIVKEGLRLIKSGRCCNAIKALARIGGLKEANSTAIAYTIAPRINAAGRMGDAKSALSAFLSDDINEIESYAKLLNDYNVKRQSECDLLYRSAKAMVSQKSPDNRVIALHSPDWKAGLVGIVAAKLVEEYSKPVILFTEKDGLFHGSARSVAGVNMFKALSAVKDVAVDFGGHAQAAGVTVKAEDFEEFECKLNEYLVENCDVSDFIQITEVEEIVTEKFTVEFARELSLLEPFGISNKKPLFAVDCGKAFATPIKIGSPHISFKTDHIDLLMFNGFEKLNLLNSEIDKTIVFEPNISIFNGKESLKGHIKEIATVVSCSDGVKSAVLSGQLDFLNENGSFISIDDDGVKGLLRLARKEIYGTLFIVNSLNTLQKFEDTKHFTKSVLAPDGKGNISVITYGSDGKIPEGYDKIVYLDKPLSVIETDKEVYVNCQTDGACGYNIRTERESLGKVFVAIKNRPQGFIRITELLDSVDLDIDTVTFAVKVFVELGLVIPQGGRYRAVSGIKRDLTDSSVYKSIKRIFG